MKVDIDGLAASIKAQLRKGGRHDEMTFMVDELVKYVRQLEEQVRDQEQELRRFAGG